MVNPAKLPENVLEALRRRYGYAADDPTPDSDIGNLTPEQAFVEFCEWRGLRGWGETLISALRGCEAADVSPPGPPLEPAAETVTA